jgi:hypothetical protein
VVEWRSRRARYVEYLVRRREKRGVGGRSWEADFGVKDYVVMVKRMGEAEGEEAEMNRGGLEKLRKSKVPLHKQGPAAIQNACELVRGRASLAVAEKERAGRVSRCRDANSHKLLNQSGARLGVDPVRRWTP